MIETIVTIFGIGLIGFIYWFFFGKKNQTIASGSEINILVDGGYSPQIIKLKNNQKTKLFLTRKDPNTCLEEFIIPDFKIKKYLPLNKSVEIEVNPKNVGEYPFHCGMNMFHGKVIVENE